MQRGIEFAIGLAITLATLSDVFISVLVPGPSYGGLASWARKLTLPLWRHGTKLLGTGRRISNLFAPILFFLTFMAWLLLLLAGFGLMFHANADFLRRRDKLFRFDLLSGIVHRDAWAQPN